MMHSHAHIYQHEAGENTPGIGFLRMGRVRGGGGGSGVADLPRMVSLIENISPTTVACAEALRLRTMRTLGRAVGSPADEKKKPKKGEAREEKSGREGGGTLTLLAPLPPPSLPPSLPR